MNIFQVQKETERMEKRGRKRVIRQARQCKDDIGASRSRDDPEGWIETILFIPVLPPPLLPLTPNLLHSATPYLTIARRRRGDGGNMPLVDFYNRRLFPRPSPFSSRFLHPTPISCSPPFLLLLPGRLSRNLDLNDSWEIVKRDWTGIFAVPRALTSNFFIPSYLRFFYRFSFPDKNTRIMF